MTNLPPTTDDVVDPIFSDDGFYARYEAIQKEISKYDTLRLLDLCLRYLHAPAADQMAYLQRHPWLMLLLMKWVLVAKRAFKKGRPAPSEQQFNELAQMMYDLGERKAARMPSQFEHVRLFFRAMAYQQFLFQRETNLTAIARQHF